MHRRLAQVDQLCMVLHTRASDTPRLGDTTGHYVNMIPASSSGVTFSRMGAVEQSANTLQHDPEQEIRLAQTRTLYLFIDETRWGLGRPEADAKLPKVP